MILAMLLLDDGGSEILETWKDSMFEILIYSGPYYCHYDAIMCHYIDSLHFAMVICVVFFSFIVLDMLIVMARARFYTSCWTKSISKAPKACKGFLVSYQKKHAKQSLDMMRATSQQRYEKQ